MSNYTREQAGMASGLGLNPIEWLHYMSKIEIDKNGWEKGWFSFWLDSTVSLEAAASSVVGSIPHTSIEAVPRPPFRFPVSTPWLQRQILLNPTCSLQQQQQLVTLSLREMPFKLKGWKRATSETRNLPLSPARIYSKRSSDMLTGELDGWGLTVTCNAAQNLPFTYEHCDISHIVPPPPPKKK